MSQSIDALVEILEENLKMAQDAPLPEKNQRLGSIAAEPQALGTPHEAPQGANRPEHFIHETDYSVFILSVSTAFLVMRAHGMNYVLNAFSIASKQARHLR